MESLQKQIQRAKYGLARARKGEEEASARKPWQRLRARPIMSSSTPSSWSAMCASSLSPSCPVLSLVIASAFAASDPFEHASLIERHVSLCTNTSCLLRLIPFPARDHSHAVWQSGLRPGRKDFKLARIDEQAARVPRHAACMAAAQSRRR